MLSAESDLAECVLKNSSVCPRGLGFFTERWKIFHTKFRKKTQSNGSNSVHDAWEEKSSRKITVVLPARGLRGCLEKGL